ncbi:MAG TPA: CocE/NonD family hydrolase [Acidimicrobiales bacterium]
MVPDREDGTADAANSDDHARKRALRFVALAASVAALLGGAPAVGNSAGDGTPEQPFDYFSVTGLSQPTHAIERHAYTVPMRDGVELYVEVVRPATEGKYPVVMELSPYHGLSEGRDGSTVIGWPRERTPIEPVDGGELDADTTSLTNYFAPRGYAVAIVDLRGTGRSEGCLDQLGRVDAGDAKEIVEWAADQPWSSGRVGVAGFSYAGGAATLAVAQQPPQRLHATAGGGLSASSGAVPGSVSFTGDPTGVSDGPGSNAFMSVDDSPQTGHVMFVSDPLAQDTFLAGTPSLTLAGSVTAPRVHLNAVVWSLAPDGTMRRLTAFAISPELRNGAATTTPVIPAERMQLRPPGWPALHRVDAGHRLVLRVTTSDTDKVPTFAVDPNVTVFTGPGGTVLELPVATKPKLVEDTVPTTRFPPEPYRCQDTICDLTEPFDLDHEPEPDG